MRMELFGGGSRGRDYLGGAVTPKLLTVTMLFLQLIDDQCVVCTVNESANGLYCSYNKLMLLMVCKVPTGNECY